MRARLGPAGMLRTMTRLPDGPRPRRYELTVRSCVCSRCGRRLAARTDKLLRTMLRANLRTCARPALA